MRASGILMPIFSLPSDYGVGTLGKAAFDFVDFLKKAGQTYWQILPINPTGAGDSPYQSFSTSAGNSYFIDLDLLKADGLLRAEDYENVDFGNDDTTVDYGKLYANRNKVLEKAFERFNTESPVFSSFCRSEKEWLDDYSLFSAFKEYFKGESWRRWDEDYRIRDPETLANAENFFAERINFYKFVQFEFFKQWTALKRYANENGIKIIGDIPIYAADDSADVWANPRQFELDSSLVPKSVAGCPPDAFSDEGQLWGMPVYDWDYMRLESEPFGWWRRRMKRALEIYDVVRIDHFRAFESYYCIEHGAKTAKRGIWKKGPGMELFEILKKDYGGPLPIIAEDLGTLTDEVHKLLKDSGFPGMKVLQFAFDTECESDYLPHNHIKNCVVYTGTHDNDTIIGWEQNGNKKQVEFAKKYMNSGNAEGLNWTMIRTALASVADTAILMMPDFMGLGSEARINTPSTFGGNWKWRMQKGCDNDWLAGIIREKVAIYGRIPEKGIKNK